MNSRLGITFTASSLVLALLAACSSAPPATGLVEGNQTAGDTKAPSKLPAGNNNPGNKNDTTPPPAGQQPGGSDDQQGGDPVPPPAPGTGVDCSGKTGDACWDCCDQAHPEGELWVETFDKCVCVSPGICRTQCATSLCAGGQPSAACELCLENAAQCETQATTACNAVPGCAAAEACGAKCN